MDRESKRVFKTVSVFIGPGVPMPDDRKLTEFVRVQCVRFLESKAKLRAEHKTKANFRLREPRQGENSLVVLLRTVDGDPIVQAIKDAGFTVASSDPKVFLTVGPIPPSTNQSELKARLEDGKLAPLLLKSEVHYDSVGVAKHLRLTCVRSKLAELMQQFTAWTAHGDDRSFTYRERIPPRLLYCRHCWGLDHFSSVEKPCTRPVCCGWCGGSGHKSTECKLKPSTCPICKSSSHPAVRCPETRWQTVELNQSGKRLTSLPFVPRPRSRAVAPAASFAAVAAAPSLQIAQLEADIKELKQQMSMQLRSHLNLEAIAQRNSESIDKLTQEVRVLVQLFQSYAANTGQFGSISAAMPVIAPSLPVLPLQSASAPTQISQPSQASPLPPPRPTPHPAQLPAALTAQQQLPAIPAASPKLNLVPAIPPAPLPLTHSSVLLSPLPPQHLISPGALPKAVPPAAVPGASKESPSYEPDPKKPKSSENDSQPAAAEFSGTAEPFTQLIGSGRVKQNVRPRVETRNRFDTLISLQQPIHAAARNLAENYDRKTQ